MKPIDKVIAMQANIAEAFKCKDIKTVNDVQIRLMRSREVAHEAVRHVKRSSGGKTSGIDGVVWETDQDIRNATEQVRDAMAHPKQYKAKGRKCVMIPKPGTTEKRKLMIPTLFDRAVQKVYTMATDPVVECQSDPHSFGYRKGRSTIHCNMVRLNAYRGKYAWNWGFETDIAKCFDTIPHDLLMRRTPNEHGKHYLEQFLKAGDVGKTTRQLQKNSPIDVGAPQGGVVSPILCNIALNGRESHVIIATRSKYIRVVRYADDLWITIPYENIDKVVKDALITFLGQRGMKLKESKTKTVNILEGSNFLGWNIKRAKREVQWKQEVPERTCVITPTKESVNRMIRIINDTVKPGKTDHEIVFSLNPVRTGWCNYYYYSYHCRQAFSKVSYHLVHKRWERDKALHPHKTAKVRINNNIASGDRSWVMNSMEGEPRTTNLVQFLRPLYITEGKQIRTKVINTNPYLFTNKPSGL